MAKNIVIAPLLALLITTSSSYCRGINNIINVKNFGAKGDGKTNDTRAVKSAFASISNTGGIVYFPAGIYLLDIIDIRPSKGMSIEIKGEKEKTVLIKNPLDPTAIALFFCEIPDVTLAFDSLKLDGSSSAKLYSWKQFDSTGNYNIENPVYGIFVYNLKKITVSNCIIENFYGDGISTYSTSEFIANNNSVSDVNGTGIKGHRVINMKIFENKIVNTGFFSGIFYIKGEKKKRSLFLGKTRFGDGIEADCDTLIAKNNIIINPGRCGIVHDLAMALGYKNSFADVENNTVEINSNKINNGNPPAGMWFEQSANVKVIANKIDIVKSKTPLVSGIRFYGIISSIICRNNTINAGNYNMILNNGIGIFEPAVTSIQVSKNTITGKFTSAIIISYDNPKSHINELVINQNEIEGKENAMKYGVRLYNGTETSKPKNQEINNNKFMNINADPIHFN